MTDESSYHIIPVVFRVKGSDAANPDITREAAAKMLSIYLEEWLIDTLNGMSAVARGRRADDRPIISRVTGDHVVEYWFPNDPTANESGRQRDGWHLEWSRGAMTFDLGNGIKVTEDGVDAQEP